VFITPHPALSHKGRGGDVVRELVAHPASPIKGNGIKLAVKRHPLRTSGGSYRAENVPLPSVGNVIDLRVSPVVVRLDVFFRAPLSPASLSPSPAWEGLGEGVES